MRSVIAVLVIFFALNTSVALAENYGGNSKAEKNRMVKLIYAKFGSGNLGRTMVCIATHEAGLNPRAVNRRDSNGGSHGLFQINGIHRSWVDFSRIYDPVYNISVAYKLYQTPTGLYNWSLYQPYCS